MIKSTFFSRWRWRFFGAGVGLLALGAVTAVIWPIASGRTDSPFFSRKSTQELLADVRRSGAPKWAPDEMVQAEAAVKAAFAAYRFEEVKLLPLRDFRGVRDALDYATYKCQSALAAGNRNRMDARASADEALAAAGRDTGRTGDVADAMHLGAYNRTLLQKSQIALREAQIMYDRGDYVQAASKAGEAGAQSRVVSQNAVQAAARYADPSLVGRWRRMIDETVGWSRSTGNPALVVLKENHRVDLYDNGRVVRSYQADIGYRSINDKQRSGDAATPEGRYKVTAKKSASHFYRALAINYPNDDDRAEFDRLKRAGVIPRGASPGGLIEIHGEGGRNKDWTNGCVALSNKDIDDLFPRVGVGTPVTIVGGDGQGMFAKLARMQVGGNNTPSGGSGGGGGTP
ncbi:MAG TPA: L,D-transpeptidase [Candidatus Polarisedimenticolaceae bacterium]|nr:L,D-transpeptidase [Candidatus Polarisedimenticolaceae bacterium]